MRKDVDCKSDRHHLETLTSHLGYFFDIHDSGNFKEEDLKIFFEGLKDHETIGQVDPRTYHLMKWKVRKCDRKHSLDLIKDATSTSVDSIEKTSSA
jgi:hypothetical protein